MSYASQDAEAAKRICDALRSAGVEVWFDAEGGLEHGDEWDAKIRRQIKECVLFIAVISASTQAREEGYFRIEWDLAAERARGIASGVAFILPIVIDDTREPAALIPDRFRTVQWTRLPGGAVTPDVQARFLKLWSHRTGALKHEAASLGSAAPAMTAKSKPVWLWVVLAVIAALAALLILKSRRSPEEIAKVVADAQKLAAAITPPAPAASSVSDARQLVGKAHALFEALDSVRDDYKLAEELIAQAKSAAPNDAEVWAADAQLNSRYSQRGWDTSDARRELARAATQRAQRLDPQSFEARFAQAALLNYTGREGTDKEKLLRDLRRERPADHRVLRELGSTIDWQGRTDEGVAFMDEAAALPGGDPLALYNKSLAYWFAGRTVETQAALRAAIALKPFTIALLLDVWYAIVLRGDLEGARATLEKIPAADLQEDRGCYFAFFLHYLRRKPDEALDQLRALPRDWINDSWYRGPKSQLMGDALQVAGRSEAAAAEWRAALKLVDARLATDSASLSLQYNRILLLAKLGEKTEAAKQFGILAQLRGIDLAGGKAVPVWATNICIILGRKTEAIQQIALGLQQVRRAVSYTAAILRLDPLYDPLRGDPEFAKVIAQAEAIESAATIAATPPRDWPKNPSLKKAITPLDRLDAIPEDFRLAEELAQQVLDKAPTDSEAVTIMARVHSMWLLRGWDRSNARYQKAKAVMERALQLAPDEPEALCALATYLYARGSENQRALELAQRAADLAPQEPRFHRMRDNCLFALTLSAPAVDPDYTVERQNAALEKAIASARRTTELFPRDALVHYELARRYRDLGRWTEFERETDVTLGLAPVANAIVWKARARFSLHGDLPGMKALLDQVPSRVRAIERTVFSYFLYAAFSGDTREGLEALNGMTEDWMIDFDYRGPKALPVGALLELSGKKELARLQYEAALAGLQRGRAANPTDVQSYLNEAWILHGLGRDADARTALRVFNEGVARPFTVSPMGTWWFQPIAANLLLGERATALALIREGAASNKEARATMRSRLALDRRMTPFRNDPEITALLAELAEKK